MSDDTQPPAVPRHGAANGATPPPGDGSWSAPRDAAGPVPLGKGETAGPAPSAGPERDLWAPPADDGSAGAGHTIASGALPIVNPSMHDQQTITSLPSLGGSPQPAPWTDPSAQAPGGYPPPAAQTSAPGTPGAANPFAPPAASYPPPAASGPFAPPANPFAAPGAGEPVPPPPVSPDGPQPGYGYPGGTSGYGYPGGTSGYGYPGPVQPASSSAGYYGWPGLPPVPSNGMGTAGLVLGIIADVVFCVWPLAIVVGILAVIFGAVGRGKAGRGEATNPGQALAGIICGVVGIALGVGFGVLVLAGP
ncbi:hypothetical protein ABZZ79_26120 [Streptomyces sp. NPDC006458]|uniref:DUF4190 domain-containing protein n=1 Tax=Streptomyces sp. NPDC006458 TaxID=3154302 RepID=UPI0033AAC7F2